MENQASKPFQDLRATLLSQAKETKTSPGVYLMKDPQNGVLYVGKAKSLRNRLTSYFQPAVHENLRIEMLVSRIQRFEIIITETEAEALILEATLIKKYKPKFNIRLKDDKAYPYLKIQLKDRFPKIEWTRRVLRDGAHYFGPFPSAWTAREVMQLLNDTFQIRTCSENTFRHRSRPCILHQIGKCTAPCVGLIDEKAYRESIQEMIQVLEGKADTLVKSLRRAMEEASEEQDYEQAAFYRDQLRNLELVTQTQGVVEAGSQRNRDVVGLARQGNEAHGTILRIRGGRLTSVQHFHLQNSDALMADAEILFDFLSQYYLSMRAVEGEAEQNPEEYPVLDVIPAEVLIPLVPDDLELLEKTLGLKVKTSEESSESAVDEQLISVARVNATYALEQSQKKAKGHGLQALEEIQERLHLGKIPHRIECYDISNILGQDAVASRVVFIDGAPDKNLYRRYKIRTVEGANDFAMMKEVLNRRFSRAEEALPDLVVVDGGRGQLAQAVAIMDELSIQGVDVVGLAKSRTERDFQATEVKASFERIFIPNRKNPVPLLPHTGAYKLLTHVRDEAHRFAISYHRLLRSKRSLRSEE